jgi:hypothetical protein
MPLFTIVMKYCYNSFLNFPGRRKHVIQKENIFGCLLGSVVFLVNDLKAEPRFFKGLDKFRPWSVAKLIEFNDLIKDNYFFIFF